MARRVLSQYLRTSTKPTMLQMVELPLDFVIATMLSYVVGIRIRDRAKSAKTAEDILVSLSGIPWGNTNVSPNEKTAMFFSELNNLFTVIDAEANINQLCNVLLILMLFRVILATNVHPRLALLTGTIGRSLDDMWHTTLLVVTLNLIFAGIASWRFGSDYDNFETINVTLQTQFMMLFGTFPDNWTDSTDLILYSVMFLMVLFILVLNFVLAIIVEAYMTLREVNEINEVEMEFFSDFYHCCTSRLYTFLYKWPPLDSLARSMELLPAKRTVGLPQLLKFANFSSQNSAVQFLNHYETFWFLKPKTVEPKEHDKLVKDIETRVAWLLGKNPPSTQDNIECMTKGWVHRASASKPHGETEVLRKLFQHLYSYDSGKSFKSDMDSAITTSKSTADLLEREQAQIQQQGRGRPDPPQQGKIGTSLPKVQDPECDAPQVQGLKPENFPVTSAMWSAYQSPMFEKEVKLNLDDEAE